MKGQSLIELIITLSIVIIIITFVSTAVITSLNNAENGKNSNLATQYAGEGMETVRKIRNDDFQTFTTANGIFCLGKDQQTLGGSVSGCSSPNIDNLFVRSIVIDQNPGCGNNLAKVTVAVSWTDGKCKGANLYCNSVPLISCFSTVNPIQAP